MSRAELLKDAVVEAARQYTAALLRWEAGKGSSWDRDDAMQTLRDALTALRKGTL